MPRSELDFKQSNDDQFVSETEDAARRPHLIEDPARHNVTGTPTDGQVAVYRTSDNKWHFEDPPNPGGNNTVFLTFCRDNNSNSNRYLSVFKNVTSQLSPYLMPRAGTITAISFASRSNVANSSVIQIRINQTVVAGATLPVTAGTRRAYVNTLNQAFSEGDELSCYLSGNANVRDPFIVVEVAY